MADRMLFKDIFAAKGSMGLMSSSLPLLVIEGILQLGVQISRITRKPRATGSGSTKTKTPRKPRQQARKRK
jgi:hypothetical protein